MRDMFTVVILGKKKDDSEIGCISTDNPKQVASMLLTMYQDNMISVKCNSTEIIREKLSPKLIECLYPSMLISDTCCNYADSMISKGYDIVRVKHNPRATNPDEVICSYIVRGSSKNEMPLRISVLANGTMTAELLSKDETCCCIETGIRFDLSHFIDVITKWREIDDAISAWSRCMSYSKDNA